MSRYSVRQASNGTWSIVHWPEGGAVFAQLTAEEALDLLQCLCARPEADQAGRTV